MDYRERPPHPGLRPWVRLYWTLAGPGAELAPQPVLPDGCTELIVHREQPFWRHHTGTPAERQAPHLFVGQMLAPAVLSPAGHADIVAIRLEPFGAHALLGLRQSDTADQILDANALGLPWLTRAMSAAQSAHTPDAALRILETSLLQRLRARRGTPVDPRVVAAATALDASVGRLRIDEIARRVGASPRQLERLFLDQIGTTPKRFARVMRFQATATSVLNGDAPSLADVSAANGYFDQAHMIRDFVTFAGTTPGQFAGRLGELTRVMLS